MEHTACAPALRGVRVGQLGTVLGLGCVGAPGLSRGVCCGWPRACQGCMSRAAHEKLWFRAVLAGGVCSGMGRWGPLCANDLVPVASLVNSLRQFLPVLIQHLNSAREMI